MRDLNNANPLKQQLLKSVKGLEGWFKSLTVNGVSFDSIVADLTELIRTVAYVNFDRNTASPITTAYSQTGFQVTVNLNAHGHRVGHFVFVSSSTGGTVAGGYIITAVTTNSFTYTSSSSLSTTGNVTLAQYPIRAGKNVHSVYSTSAGGVSYINLTTALPNSNYATQYTCGGTAFNTTTIGDGCVIGQTVNYLAVYSYTVTGSAFSNFPYNAVTIVQ